MFDLDVVRIGGFRLRFLLVSFLPNKLINVSGGGEQLFVWEKFVLEVLV